MISKEAISERCVQLAKQYMKRYGLTQRDFCTLANLHYGVWRQCSSGHRELSLDAIAKILNTIKHRIEIVPNESIPDRPDHTDYQ